MLRSFMQRMSQGGRVRWLMAALAVVIIGGLISTTMSSAAQRDPVQAALQKAYASGSYRFDSDIEQITTPAPAMSNVGRSPRTDTFRMEGRTDLRTSTTEMQLMPGGGATGTPGTFGVRVVDGKTYIQQAGGAWKESSTDMGGATSQGDGMAFLHGVRDITAHERETRAGVSFTRYTFIADGQKFAIHMRDQIEASMRARGAPAQTRIDIPKYYSDMTGNGELWVSDNGLPLRASFNLDFPQQNNEYVSATIVVHFNDYGAAAAGLAGIMASVRAYLPSSSEMVSLVLIAGMVVLVVRGRRSRPVQGTLVSLVIAAMLAGPLLQAKQADAYNGTQNDAATAQRQAENEQAMLARVDELNGTSTFNAYESPFVAADRRERAADIAARHAGRTQTTGAPAVPAADVIKTDAGLNTDGDGLTDYQEQRIGTNPDSKDTDDDRLVDGLEAKGWTFGGKTFYLNPLEADTNNDGIIDGLEWDTNANGQPDDTDADGTPDVLDYDNDNDGVPDRLDLAASVRTPSTATGFGETNPFQLTLNNLQADKPTLVDFQVRPTDPKHLGFALSVLDWPTDSEGQLVDVDNQTLADVATLQNRPTAPNDSNGDMKLLPMLEIRIQGTPTNLPTKQDLLPYNITSKLLDANTQLLYVPLSVVTDESTGSRVAFSGRMRYLPTGTWPTPHKIRMVWVVQALEDQPCDSSKPEAVAAGCAADNYFHNIPQVIQTYYDNWMLTGLNVTEDRVTRSAIVYEDPAVDTNLKDDAALWALADGLDNSFLSARDQDNNKVRDVTVSEIYRRFNRTTNANVPEEQRWSLIGDRNILAVESRDYVTFDQAVVSNTTKLKSILDTKFTSAAQNDPGIKPLLMVASEQNYRTLSLERAAAGDGYVEASDTGLVVDMQPSGKAAEPIVTQNSLKWTAYCYSAASGWAPCATDEYWNELDARYLNTAPLADTPNTPEMLAGEAALLKLYYTSLGNGISRIAQRGTIIGNLNVKTRNDSELTANVRLANTGGVVVAKFIADKAFFSSVDPNAGPGVIDEITRLGIKGYLGKVIPTAGQVGSAIKSVPSKIANYFKNNALKGTLIVVGVAVGIAALTPLAFYFLNDYPEAQITVKFLTTVVAGSIGLVLAVKSITDFAGSAIGSAMSLKSILGMSSEVLGASRVAGIIGTVIAIGVTWGFFIYSAVTEGLQPGTPEFGKGLAEAIASTVFIIVLAFVSATVFGTILVAILGVVDAILTAACELDEDLNGSSVLRQNEFYGGACVTLSTTVIKAIAYFLYNYDVMIDTNKENMVRTGQFDTQLADPNKGFVSGNAITFSLPITTTVTHKDPDPANGLYIYPYLYLFSPDNLRSTTFLYNLNANAVPLFPVRDQMKNQWYNVVEDHKLLLTPMYRGTANSTATSAPQSLPVGLNKVPSLYLNTGYALPAYECIGIPNPIIPFFPPVIPICYVQTFNGTDSAQIKTLKYDILPATIDAFMAVAVKPDGGLGLSWDTLFPSLVDADNDGLLAKARNGADPDDTKADTDNDGLADAYEMERGMAGVAYSPIQCDTDNDGLADGQEETFGSDPARADTDNDGLVDGDEVWHQVYTAQCQPTSTWTGGWDVVVNGASALTVHVSSNPATPDTDGDGLTDKAEKDLLGGADVDNRPYNPLTPNSPLLTMAISTDDADGFVSPGQFVDVTTQVIAQQPVVPGSLVVDAPETLIGKRQPYTLPFATAPQTVTHVTELLVRSPNTTQRVNVTSTARTRLPNTSGAAWALIGPSVQSVGSFPSPKDVITVDGAARQDRQDSYLLSADVQTGGSSDITALQIPSGQSAVLDNKNAAASLRDKPVTACNNNNVCMTMWEEIPAGSVRTIRGAMTDANGVRTRFIDNYQQPTSTGAVISSDPAIASDGDGFLVATAIVTQTTSGAYNYGVQFQRFDRNGNVGTRYAYRLSTASTFPDFEWFSKIDLVWVGTRYLVAFREFKQPNATSVQVLNGLLDQNGQRISAGWTSLGQGDVANSLSAIPSLAFNTSTGTASVTYGGVQNSIKVMTFNTQQTGLVNSTAIGTGASPQISYEPTSRSFLVTYQDQSSGNQRVVPLANNLSAAYGVGPINFGFTGSESRGPATLVSPSPLSVPVIDLRFEEVPGTTQFVDSSGNGYDATCTSATCPVSGDVGARNLNGVAVGTPASDYAMNFRYAREPFVDPQFAYVPNPAALQYTVNDSFTWSAWVKPTSDGYILAKGAGQSGSVRLYVNNTGQAAMELIGSNGTSRMIIGPDLRDNKWHHIVMTMNRANNLARLYIDGAYASGSDRSVTGPLSTNDNLMIGQGLNGSLDEVKIYRTALGVDTIKALYDNNMQSYSMIATPRTSTVSWTKAGLRPVDRRGGAVTYSASVPLTIDADKPTARVTSLVDGQYVRTTSNGLRMMVSGTASDPTSGVSYVEVGGPYTNLVASGAEAWTGEVEVRQGKNTLTAKATDVVFNREFSPSGPSVTVWGDQTAPTIDYAAPGGGAKPYRLRRTGQWVVDLSGKISDPDIESGKAGSGIDFRSIEVQLVRPGSNGSVEPATQWQRATATYTAQGYVWTIQYAFTEDQVDPTPQGNFWLLVRAKDKVGNEQNDADYLESNADWVGFYLPLFDVRGPGADLRYSDNRNKLLTSAITMTSKLGGVITDTGGAGITNLRVAVTPLQQVAPLSDTLMMLRFDENTGPFYYQDSSAHGNAAWCASNVCPTVGVAGVDGTAIQFTNAFGNQAYIDGQRFDTLIRAANTTYSVQGWVKLGTSSSRAFTLLDGSAYRLVVAANTGRAQWQMNGYSNGSSAVQTKQIEGTTDLRDNQWHYLVGTFNNRLGVSRLYVDGQLIGSRSDVKGSYFGFPTHTIGEREGREATVDMVAVFEHDLTAAEVSGLYQGASRTFGVAVVNSPGTQSSTWVYDVPAGLEGLYQVDLRGTDKRGNTQLSGNAYRGVIDLVNPRVTFTGRATGASMVDGNGVRKYEVIYTCDAQDAWLNEDAFACPGNSIQPPTRTTNADPIVRAFAPDVTYVTRLTNTYTVWQESNTPTGNLRACDIYGRCTTQVVQTPAGIMAQPAAVSGPKAVIVSPAVSSSGTATIEVSAESTAPLKEVVLVMDGTVVARQAWTEAQATKQALANFEVAVPNGRHVLAVRATDWAGKTQTQPYTQQYTRNTARPAVTVDSTTTANGFLRIEGRVNDAVGVNAVRVRVGTNGWTTATVTDGRWKAAYPLIGVATSAMTVTAEATNTVGVQSTVTQRFNQTANPAR